MACRLSGAKLLSEPVVAYCELNSWKQISVKFESKCDNFHTRKLNWKCICLGLSVLRNLTVWETSSSRYTRHSSHAKIYCNDVIQVWLNQRRTWQANGEINPHNIFMNMISFLREMGWKCIILSGARHNGRVKGWLYRDHSANKRRHYYVTPSLTVRARTQNDPYCHRDLITA